MVPSSDSVNLKCFGYHIIDGGSVKVGFPTKRVYCASCYLAVFEIMLLNIVKRSMKGPVKISFGQSKSNVRY